MNNSKFKMNLGEVVVVLNKEELVLKPTYQAASRISNQFNGFRDARLALVAENFDAVVFILRIGLNLNGSDARELPERVYKNPSKLSDRSASPLPHHRAPLPSWP